ncbi:hypothetical protein [Pseudomonas cerasi]|uniref:Uncharacterized protein n=1 Tax=Pseudomonas cerasi TaxID=1583341 RepID=A0A193SHV2_9PSED|nr:hypothetical protein [Pseudomonas cerasi]CZT26666.1 hypothetical protein PCPL58_0210 [Pseudomonas cerasi]SOS14352.1 hypothetical protein PL963_00212 [Pseudomonas cerasi]
MQLHEVDEIKELFIVDEVNEALQKGWKIVAVVSSAEPHGGDLPVVCYVLGKKKLTGIAAAMANARGETSKPNPRREDAKARAKEAFIDLPYYFA